MENSSVCSVDMYGTKTWRNEKGQLHREDGPAIEWSDGDWEWRLNGKRHRICGPCAWISGYYYWRVNSLYITDIVLECLEITGFKETIHLGILAERMCELGDFRLQEILDNWRVKCNGKIS